MYNQCCKGISFAEGSLLSAYNRVGAHSSEVIKSMVSFQCLYNIFTIKSSLIYKTRHEHCYISDHKVQQ